VYQHPPEGCGTTPSAAFIISSLSFRASLTPATPSSRRRCLQATFRENDRHRQVPAFIDVKAITDYRCIFSVVARLLQRYKFIETTSSDHKY
jgi:hypothetical protein